MSVAMRYPMLRRQRMAFSNAGWCSRIQTVEIHPELYRQSPVEKVVMPSLNGLLNSSLRRRRGLNGLAIWSGRICPHEQVALFAPGPG